MGLFKLGKWAMPSLLVAVALGLLISVQFQLQKKVEHQKELNKQKVEAVSKLVERAALQNDYLEKQQAELKKKIDAYNNAQGGVSPELKAKMETTGILTGDTPVEGPGIHIEIDDRKVTLPFIVSDQLLSIVNMLKYADAEAIEVNGQRIGPRSFIVNSGSLVLVNGVPISRAGGTHWEIEAIGNQEFLKYNVQSLIDPLLAEDVYPELKVTITAQVVKIPRLKVVEDFAMAKQSN